MNTLSVPIVQFERIFFSAIEPLSNYFIDSESVTLTVVRSGDINATFGIEYYIIDGQIPDSGGDNETVRGADTFLNGVSKKQISIPLKAYRNTSNDTFLTVILSQIVGPTIAKVGENFTAVIHIKNKQVTEPLLPGIPVIVNKGFALRKWISQESPLRCIMVRLVQP